MTSDSTRSSTVLGNVHSRVRPEETVEDHLERALEHAESPTARFHIREALQLRIAEQ